MRVKLRHLDALNAEKQRIAARYLKEINHPLVRLPLTALGTNNVWHQFVIGCKQRDALAAYLKERGIGTEIHYPIAPHLAEAYRYLNIEKGSLPKTEALVEQVLSLPSYIGLTAEEQSVVICAINDFSLEKDI